MLIEIAALAFFDHLEVLVVESALIELADRVALCLIIVLKRLLKLIVEPLDYVGLILGELLDLIERFIVGTVAELLLKHLLFGGFSDGRYS